MFKFKNTLGMVEVLDEERTIKGEEVEIQFKGIPIRITGSKYASQSKMGKSDVVELLDAYTVLNSVGVEITVVKIRTSNGEFLIPLHSSCMIEGLSIEGARSDYSCPRDCEEDDED